MLNPLGIRSRHPRSADTGEALKQAVQGLLGAIDAGAAHLPEEDVLAAEKILKKAGERLSFTGGATVVVLAGATGSGKSSLFNRLVGEEVSTVGQRRPTTSRPTAAIWGPDPTAELLDWLRVPRRHHVDPENTHGIHAGAHLDGLVLVDLPDIDSTEPAHRREADRVLGLADVFIWVTDPQKYADALLHEEYLAAARHHEAVTLVLLNQADRLAPADQLACRDDLHRLLERDGLGGAQAVLCSARTGVGLPEVAGVLTAAVAQAQATRVRLLGDVRHEAARLREHVADGEADLETTPDDALIDALAATAGVPVVLQGVEAHDRRRALAATGWPVTRWIRALRPDPLKRLRLEARRASQREVTDEVSALPDDIDAVLRRSSVPEPTPAARAGVELVTRRLVARAGAGLPPRWADALDDVGRADDADLADALDQAVLGTPVRTRDRLWWRLAGVAQWLLLVAAIVGLGWLTALAAFSYLQFPTPPVPTWGPLPWPTVLAVAGVAGGLLLAMFARAAASSGARRHRRRVEERLREQIAEVARDHLLAPLRAVLDRHRRTREHLDAALS